MEFHQTKLLIDLILPFSKNFQKENCESKQVYARYYISHIVKFIRALLDQLLSNLHKSSEKEFTLIQSPTYCLG